MNVSTNQNKGDNDYQSVCQERLGKIIHPLLSTDDTAAIVKCLERTIKVRDNFLVIENGALTNATHLPQSLTKTHQFFHRGKPKTNGSKIYTNMRILHTVEIRDVIGDMKHELET